MGSSVRQLYLTQRDTAPPPRYREAEDRADEISMLARFAMDMCRLAGRDPGPLVEQFLQAGEQDRMEGGARNSDRLCVPATKIAPAQIIAFPARFSPNFR